MIIPWFVAIPLLPVAAAFWVLGLTVDAIRWVWRPRHRQPPKDGVASVRVTIR